jgi:hypothetical protein
VGPAAAALSGHRPADAVPRHHRRRDDHALLPALYPRGGRDENHPAFRVHLHPVRVRVGDWERCRAVCVVGGGGGRSVGPRESGRRRVAADGAGDAVRAPQRLEQGRVHGILRASQHGRGRNPRGHAGAGPRLLTPGRAWRSDGLLDNGPGARQSGGDRGLEPHARQPPRLAVPVPTVRCRRLDGMGGRVYRAPGALAAATRPVGRGYATS